MRGDVDNVDDPLPRVCTLFSVGKLPPVISFRKFPPFMEFDGPRPSFLGRGMICPE